MRTKLAGATVFAALALAPAAAADDAPPAPPVAKEPPPTLSVGKPAVRGRTLSLPISCVRNGSVRVSQDGRRLGTSAFRCTDLRATARIRIPRRLVGTRDAHVTVTARDGRSVVTSRMSLSGQPVAQLAGLATGWWLRGECDGYNASLGQPAFSVMGGLFSNLAGGDYYTIAVRMVDVNRNVWLSDWVYSREFYAGLPGTGYWMAPMDGVFYIPHNRVLAVWYSIKSRRHGAWIDSNWLPLTATSPAVTSTSGLRCGLFY